MPQNLSVLIAAGGTGGHLFPALAVAEQMGALAGNGFKAQFVGTPNRIEAEKVPALGYAFHPMPISPFRGFFSIQSYLLPFNLYKSIAICRRIIRESVIDAVICTGAYLSYPAGIAASKCGVPLILMESNVNPGKTIKMLSKKASLIITSFADTEGYFEGSTRGKVRMLGNPVRKDIISLPGREASITKLGLASGKKTLLIFGGSLGAASINKATENIIKEIDFNQWQVIWQTGKDYTAPSELPDGVFQSAFIDDMASAYSAADLVICRSGATTAAELCVAGKASVLIPYPSASNNEQEENARVLEKTGAAKMVKNEDAVRLIPEVFRELSGNEVLMKEMSGNAKKLALPEAAINSAKAIFELISK